MAGSRRCSWLLNTASMKFEGEPAAACVAPTDDGMTPLYMAAQWGHEAVALIEKGADIKKVVDGGFTPLLMAAEKGHDAVVRALIEADVDINKATDIGMPPLYMAAEFGREAVVLALIKAGADVNKATDNGATPLSTSMSQENKEQQEEIQKC